MEIKAQVRSIENLMEYFFHVPDYQREYVWQAHDQVEQFLIDIEPDLTEKVQEMSSYFLGAIIIIRGKERWEVIDGQQRLTTLVLFMCALRDVLKQVESFGESQKAKHALDALEDWLYKYDMATEQSMPRLELQYEESSNYLSSLVIPHEEFEVEETPSVQRMRRAYKHILSHLESVRDADGLDGVSSYISFVLTKLEIVVIEAEELSSALKIFETINQRGVGLNAMDLVKNLLFAEAHQNDFERIKDVWKEIVHNLANCGEEEKPLRFLRYFITARYFQTIVTKGKTAYVIKEDQLYKWIISKEGKAAIGYENHPLDFAKELRDSSKRYSRLVNSTLGQTNEFQSATGIGYINKMNSKSHLVLLLALDRTASDDCLNFLAQQLESYYFFTNSLGVAYAKRTEKIFASWAKELRNAQTRADVCSFVDETMIPHLLKIRSEFVGNFRSIPLHAYHPKYRMSYVLCKLENNLRSRCGGYPALPFDSAKDFQFEHILPQTPKDGILPPEFADKTDYDAAINRLGNYTLLESNINQALNKANDLTSNQWFDWKLSEYKSSSVLITQMLSSDFSIGQNTKANQTKSQLGYSYIEWNRETIAHRQNVMMELAFDTWRLNGKRLDEVESREVSPDEI